MGRGAAVYVLAVLVAINFLNYLDRYLPAAAAPAIQAEFHLNDSQLGLLGTAFLLVYALAAVPLGLWADRGVRKVVIATGVAIWSLATLFTGLARSYAQLVVTRGVLGIGEASYFPAGTALLGDLWPKHLRARAISFRDAGSVVGIAVGFVGGGIVTQALGWRSAFFFCAIPGLFLALLALTMPEPRRGHAEARGPELEHVKDASVRTFRDLWVGIPTLRAQILSQTLLFWVLAALSVFLPLLVHRRYGLGVAASATVAGGILIAGGLVGTFLGGWLGDWRARRTAGGHLQVGMAGFVLGAVFIVLAMVSSGLGPFIVFGLFGTVSLYLYTAPFTAMLQNMVIPSTRASAMTLTLLVAHLFGDSWSPVAVGALSDALHSLTLALGVTCPLVLLGAAAVAGIGLRTAERDTRSMEEAWARHPSEPAPT
jgi:MFS transporter, Spinster family, sphingosine-1-phosphate transporter